MLTRHITKRMTIPHEPDHWMELRRLSWTDLQHASDVHATTIAQRLRAMGSEIVTAVTAARQQREELTPALDTPELNYDQRTLLERGIAAWSYPEPVTPENIQDLDEETAAWAMRAIIDLARGREGDERKNSSPGSTATSPDSARAPTSGF